MARPRRKKTEEETPVPVPVEVTDLDRGKAAQVLSKIWHESRQKGGRYWSTKVRTERRYSDPQVAALLGLSLDEMLRVRETYQAAVLPWPEHRILLAVTDFLKREKRWPRRRDFAASARAENGLPSSSTYDRFGGETLLRIWLTQSKNVRSLHPNVILAIWNVTVRADAIAAYGGYERIIQKGGGTLRQKDDYGKLWELPPEPDVDETVALFVEVVNATVVDGKRERFFLRVPPETTSAKAAVEWSFAIPAGTLEEFAAQT